MALVSRKNINKKYVWNTEDMYSSFKDWELDFKNLKKNENKWNSLTKYKNSLKNSSLNLKKTLDAYFDFNRKLENLFVYSHLLLDEDLSNDKAKNAYGMISALFYNFQEKASWIEPEILQMKKEDLKKLVNDKNLKEYSFYLKNLLRLKNHTLKGEEEEILARISQTFQTPYKAFASFNNADLVFGKIKDCKGKTHELTHGKYLNNLRIQDRQMRKQSFLS